MSTVRDALETILNKVDFTSNQCSMTAPVAAALPEEDLLAAREALKVDTGCNDTHRAALLLMLDQIDFTHFACSPFDMVAACIPLDVFDRCRKALEVPA